MIVNLISREFWLVCVLVILGLMMHIWGPTDSLDIKFYYSFDEALTFFKNLSGSEAKAYFLNEILDFGFLTTYSLLFLCVFQRLFKKNSQLWFVAIIPGSFDFIETAAIILVLMGFMKEPPVWLGVATCLKYTSGFLFILATTFRWIEQRRHIQTIQ